MSISAALALDISDLSEENNIENMPGLISSRRWVLGLCGGPDAAHVAYVVPRSHTGSSGVGKHSELSVSPNKQIVCEKDILQAARDFGSVRLSFVLNLTEQTQISWETVLWNSVLYVQVPSCVFPGGSKEGFVALLEYAEEVLRCSHVVVCMKKDGADRGDCLFQNGRSGIIVSLLYPVPGVESTQFLRNYALLVRTFMFLGFVPLAPGHVLIPANTDPANLFMLYAIE